MNNKEWKKWIFWFSFAVATIVVYKTIDSVSAIFSWVGDLFSLLMPFFMAVLVAYILYMPCKKIEQIILKFKSRFLKKHARGISVLLVYVMAVLLIFIVMKFILPTVSNSITDLASNLPNYFNDAVNYVNNLDEHSLIVRLNLTQYINNLQEINIDKIIEFINLDNINYIVGGLVGATNVIFDLFVTVVVSVYMLLERNDIKSFIQNLSKAIFDKKTNEALSRYYKKTNSIFFSYISSQLLDAVVVGVITAIAMGIMKVKYAVLLGFLIGLFNIIPYFRSDNSSNNFNYNYNIYRGNWSSYLACSSCCYFTAN